jgi:FAD/FMN-containing dehydrogenase
MRPLAGDAAARWKAHAEKREALAAAIKAAGGAVRLGKTTSNLFRTRKDGKQAAVQSLDVRAFNQVLSVNPDGLTMDVEGMTPYETAVAGALAHGCLPAVVPELKTITIGGALTGVGIESSSFRYGFVHETVAEMDILLPDGRIVLARPDNGHRDLFFGFANSYGTLGYVIRARIRLVRAKRFVELRHRKFASADLFLAEMKRLCDASRFALGRTPSDQRFSPDDGPWDFIEGSVFSSTVHVLTTGRFVDNAPYAGDYTHMRPFYQSLLHRETDFLTASDYIWRWDTDWFWCSQRMGLKGFWARLLLGRWMLGSRNLWKVFNWYRRHDVAKKLAPYVKSIRESQTWEPVIQDVEVPADRGAEFLEFFHREIGIKPVWVCPVQKPDPEAKFDLYEMDPDTLYLNFGFWDSVESKVQMPKGHYNRMIEVKVAELGGRKSLYSESFYPEDEFWRTYNGFAYKRLKEQYDPEDRLLNLYQKTVRAL